MKRVIILAIVSIAGFNLSAQNPTNQKSTKQERREERQQRINALVKQEEEGALIYSKQSVMGIELRTNGYGLFYEMGKAKTRRKTNIYVAELTEIKDPKEEKNTTDIFSFGNPYVYGKVNNFYQFKLGLGQQYLFGQKGNKNGVAVAGIYQAGLSLAMLRPYYIQISDGNGTREIKYSTQDSSLFLDQSVIQGGAGLGKGWNEMKLKPGIFARAALRFDLAHYNETATIIEVGISAEAYTQKIPILLLDKQHQFFFQGHAAIVFGHRR
ncbi:MAG TPA: hypothetical protein VFP87_03055 [Chitinophagaceae bacterium]|nr:hypothetical protein [Chitinophagaceae bacterium]